MAQNVLGLEIPMKETVLVEVSQSCGNFEEYGSDFIFGEGAITLLGTSVDLVKVALEVVEDHVQLRICKNDLFELDDVGMF